jgi:hypothetical protein
MTGLKAGKNIVEKTTIACFKWLLKRRSFLKNECAFIFDISTEEGLWVF